MKSKRIFSFLISILICFAVTASSVLADNTSLSKKYNLSKEDNLIKGLPEEITPDELLATMPEGTEINTSSQYIGTGTEVTISDTPYIFIVAGDVEGSGVVDSTDYLRIKQFCLEEFVFDDIAFVAADVDSSDEINTTDYLRVKGHFLGLFDLYEDSLLPEEDVYSNPTFVVDNVKSSNDGKTVEVCVKILNNPGILGMVLSVSYDDSAFTLVEHENGEALSELVLQKPAKYQNGSNFVWYGSEISEAVDGNVIKLVFDVSEAAKGSYPIEISYTEGSIFDSSYSTVSVDIVNGSIEIIK